VIKNRLGKFERMAYVIDFNKESEELEEKLRDNFHVISIHADSNEQKETKLAEVFKNIQQRLDIQAGARFRESKPEAYEDITDETFKAASEAKDASSILASYSNLCFVMMPYSTDYNLVFSDIIKPVAEKFDLTVLRGEEAVSTESIIERIRTAIIQSRLCIADVSGQNPNVMYELGLAWDLKKPTVLLTKNKYDIPYEIESLRLVLYDMNELDKARTALEYAIWQTLGYDRLTESKKLIESGMYRAAAATLGILIEQSLQQLINKKSTVAKKEGPRIRRLPIIRMLDELSSEEIISPDDRGNLYEAAKIRNRAVHDLKEPRKEEVQVMFDVVKNFAEKYFGASI